MSELSNLAALRTDPDLQAKVDRLIQETKPQSVYEAFAFSNHMNKRDGFETHTGGTDGS